MDSLTCFLCEKKYNDRAGLWRHKKKCSEINKEDIIVKNSNTGDFVKNYKTNKDLSYNMNVKNYNYNIECKNIENKIIVDGVSYKMVPIEVQNKDGQMYKILAYVQEMK